ncbi:MAG TPA: phytanoyl-CoA dioxygenase family protein [Thermoanaerobaculia bacterium]|nr:phytanoyl-CoA dioxygenase family protein [Thermoanaerobaculia bacterium]
MLDFDRHTLPRADRADFLIDLQRAVAAGDTAPDVAQDLRRFHEQGYLHVPGAIEVDLLDRLCADYHQAWRVRPPLKALIEGHGVVSLADAPERAGLEHHHYRLMDFQDWSETAREVMLHPAVVGRLAEIFGETPVAMQSLLFEYGSEQGMHQDFPYVQAGKLSHLVGVWVALEDVDDSNGPLFYYPGSHRRPKFDFGGGSLVYDGTDESQIADFESFLERETCSGLDKLTLHAKKGDVLFWHAALVHGGSPATDRARTRLSFVCHYSSASAYPRDRRAPHVEPVRLERNGGILYEPPAQATARAGLWPRIEARLKRLLG